MPTNTSTGTSSTKKQKGRRLIVIRRTLRTTDNPLFRDFDAETDDVCVLVNEDLLPRARLDLLPTHERCLSWHQASMILDAAELLVRELAASGVRARVARSVPEALGAQSHTYARGLADWVCDHAYDDSDSALRSAFPRGSFEFRACATMVDWREADHLRVAEAHFRRNSSSERGESSWASPYRRTHHLKQYALAHVRDRVPTLATRSEALASPTTTTAIRALRERLDACAPPAQGATQRFSLRASVGARGLRKYVESRVRKAASVMGARGWRKPDTAANVALGEFCFEEPRKNASQLSPLLSIGIVGPLQLYHALRGRGCGDEPGGAVDQLLFRECWYALGWADYDRIPAESRFWSDDDELAGWWAGRDDVARASWDTEEAPRWCDAVGGLAAWVEGRMGWRDADESMHMLRDTGWIHHLRRHVVADALCARKYLNLPFVWGERFFRHTLLDHDAPLNRANWLWLSGSAFSTAQRRNRHYNVSTYVRKPAHSCAVHASSDADTAVASSSSMSRDKTPTSPESERIRVPENVREAARLALELKRIGFAGGTATGLLRGRQLAAENATVSAADVRVMRAWFARHGPAARNGGTSYPGYQRWCEESKPRDGKYAPAKGRPRDGKVGRDVQKNSRGAVAWLLWGGTDALRWIDRIPK